MRFFLVFYFSYSTTVFANPFPQNYEMAILTTVEIDKTKFGRSAWNYFVEGKKVDAYNFSANEEYCAISDEYNNTEEYSTVKIGSRTYGFIVAGTYRFIETDGFGTHFFENKNNPKIKFAAYCSIYENNGLGKKKIKSKEIFEKHIRGIY